MNGSLPGSGDKKAVPTIGDLIVSPETSSTGADTAAGTGAAAACLAFSAAMTGAKPRRTLMRRSPSATSISLSSLSVSSWASSLTSLASIRIEPSLAGPFPGSAIAFPY
jgi:hypothetical protein